MVVRSSGSPQEVYDAGSHAGKPPGRGLAGCMAHDARCHRGAGRGIAAFRVLRRKRENGTYIPALRCA